MNNKVPKKEINIFANIEEVLRRYFFLFQLAEVERDNFSTKREEDFIVASVMIQIKHNTSKMFTEKVMQSYKESGFSKSSVNKLAASVANKFLAGRKSGELLLLPELLEIAKNGGIEVNLKMSNND